MKSPQTSPVSLSDALGVIPIGANTYKTYMHPDHGHGGSAQGGFAVSQMMVALRYHFATTLAGSQQPDTHCLQVTYLSRLPDGAATITIDEVTRGRQSSILRVAVQHHGNDRIVGYALQTNLSQSLGPTFQVPNVLQLPAAPADFQMMAANTDPYWLRFTYPWSEQSMTKSFLHAERWVPRYHHPPNIQECWLRMLPRGLKITTEMLASIIDNFARPPENFRSGSPGSHAGLLAQGYWQQRHGYDRIQEPSTTSTIATSDRSVSSENDDPGMARQALAYPTLMMNLEIKKKLPEEGVEWMYCRATTKAIQGGRYDADVVLIDREGDMVATSNQMGLMLSMDGDSLKGRSAKTRSSKL